MKFLKTASTEPVAQTPRAGMVAKRVAETSVSAFVERKLRVTHLSSLLRCRRDFGLGLC